MKKIVCLCIITALIITAVADAAYISMCDKFVRFHTIANSNSPYDQQVKMQLKDFIFESIGDNLKTCKNKYETLLFLKNNSENIEKQANSYLKEINCPDKATVCIENRWFQRKKYDGFSLPGGEYDSFKITIGKGSGKNFFCVMFPPACISKEMTKKVNEMLKGGKIEYKLKLFSKE